MSYIPPIRPNFVYHDLERVTVNGVRHYRCPDSEYVVPSVTTILDQTADKSGLEAWARRVGKYKADFIRTEAANLGTVMHEHMECYVTGRERPAVGSHPLRQNAKLMSDVMIEKGLSQVSEIWGMEARLCFPGLYAGTADLIGLYGNTPAVMDYKTTRAKMKSFDDIEDYRCQIAGYILSHNEMYGTDISCGVIFMVNRTGEFRQFIVKGVDLEIATGKFLNRVEEYYRVK